MLATLRSIVRVFVGFVLVVVAVISAANGLQVLGHELTPYVTGQLTGSLLFTLIFGIVGTKMMLRRQPAA